MSLPCFSILDSPTLDLDCIFYWFWLTEYAFMLLLSLLWSRTNPGERKLPLCGLPSTNSPSKTQPSGQSALPCPLGLPSLHCPS